MRRADELRVGVDKICFGRGQIETGGRKRADDDGRDEERDPNGRSRL